MWNCGNLTFNIHIVAMPNEMCTTDFEAVCNIKNETCLLTCFKTEQTSYSDVSFWLFTLLLVLSTTGFNVSQTLSDAICFDVLGSGNEEIYGYQRVWGSVGYGITALLGSFLTNHFQGVTSSSKDYFPALLLGLFCMIFDLLCCLKLNLPLLPKSDNILKDTAQLMKKPRIAVFLFFAMCAGICDSSVFYYMFWYLEDMATETNDFHNIKILEGLTVTLEAFCGEVIFFTLSGKIVSKIGYANCFTMCFALYSLRFGLLSYIPSIWWILPVEATLHGPTFSLFYATLVAYASAITPPGTSATTQGVVAGMDDGLGFCIGNLVGGIIYKYFGGRKLFLSFSIFAFFCSATHCGLYYTLFKQPNRNAETVASPLKPTEENENTPRSGISVTTYLPQEKNSESANNIDQIDENIGHEKDEKL